MDDVKKLIDAMEFVVKFNSKVIILKLKGRKIEDEELEKVRLACNVLCEAQVYKFDTNCLSDDLLRQIEEFVKEGL